MYSVVGLQTPPQPRTGNREADPTGGCRRGRSTVRFGKRQRTEGGHRPGSDSTSTEGK